MRSVWIAPLLAVSSVTSSLLLVLNVYQAQQNAVLVSENNKLAEIARRETTEKLQVRESNSNSAMALRRAQEEINQYSAELQFFRQELAEIYYHLEATKAEKEFVTNERNWSYVLFNVLRKDTADWSLGEIDVYLNNHNTELQKRDNLFMATGLVKYLAMYVTRYPGQIAPDLVSDNISAIENQIGSNQLLRQQLTPALIEAQLILAKHKGSA